MFLLFHNQACLKGFLLSLVRNAFVCHSSAVPPTCPAGSPSPWTRVPPALMTTKFSRYWPNPQDTCSKNPGACFFWGRRSAAGSHHQSHSSGGGTLKPVTNINDSSTFRHLSTNIPKLEKVTTLICHLKKVKTLILDSLKGDYTPRTGQVLQNVEHFDKNADFSKFQNLEIEIL